jgi:hypothetical protein
MEIYMHIRSHGPRDSLDLWSYQMKRWNLSPHLVMATTASI